MSHPSTLSLTELYRLIYGQPPTHQPAAAPPADIASVTSAVTTMAVAEDALRAQLKNLPGDTLRRLQAEVQREYARRGSPV